VAYHLAFRLSFLRPAFSEDFHLQAWFLAGHTNTKPRALAPGVSPGHGPMHSNGVRSLLLTSYAQVKILDLVLFRRIFPMSKTSQLSGHKSE